MKKFTKTVLLIVAILFATITTYAQISVRVTAHIAPPVLPVYVQPPCPTDGYLWAPGYWNYSTDDIDYYWVPGVWLAPPRSGLYWTPGYWALEDGVYGFYTGYWGPHVGYYGGVNYGFGYGGVGFSGGEWRNEKFRYNTVTGVIASNNRAAFNGQGGVVATPTEQEREAMREQHVQPTGEQLSHQQAAMADKSSFSKLNNGRPVAAALNRVNGTAFNTHGGAAAATPEARQAAIGARPGRNNTNVAGNNAARQENEKVENPKPENVKAAGEKTEQRAEKKQERTEQQAAQRQQKQQKQAPAPKQPKPVKEPEPRKIP